MWKHHKEISACVEHWKRLLKGSKMRFWGLLRKKVERHVSKETVGCGKSCICEKECLKRNLLDQSIEFF